MIAYDPISLVQVARLAVPRLAGWSIVDLLDEDGVTIRDAAAAAADPHKEDVLRELRMRHSPTIDSLQPAAQALRSGEPVVFSEFDPESLRSTVRDERHLELIMQLAPRSAVPLVARGRTIGAVTLVTSESERTYGEAELGLYISRELVRRMNGTIWVESRESEGSCFSFELPVATG